MKLKSQLHYIFLIIGILLVFFTSILFVTYWLITENIENQIESNINQAQFHVENQIRQSIENKIEICKTIAGNEILISAIENLDSLSLDSMIKEIYDFEQNNYFLITDADSKILKRINQINGARDYLYLLPDILDFIDNKYKINQNFKISHLINQDKYYLICTVPVFKDSTIVGSLSKDYNLNEILNLEKYSDLHYTFLDRNKILFTTLQIQPDLFNQFFNMHFPVFDAVLATSQSSEMINTTLDGKEIYSKFIPFGYGIPITILVSVYKSDEYEFLNRLLIYLIYIFIIFGILFLITFYVIVNRKSKQVNKLNLELNKYKKENKSESEISGTILVTRIVNLKSELNNSIEDTIKNYHQFQSELIELYDGKIESIYNDRIVALFTGEEVSIETSTQCAQSIMKIIDKESKTTNYHIAIGLNYGLVGYKEDKISKSDGKTLEIAESICEVANAGEILIHETQISKTEIDLRNIESKLWKLKYSGDEVRLVNIAYNFK